MWEVGIYWLICLLIAVAGFVWIWQRDKHRKSPWRWVPTLLRGLTFFFVAALLLAPAFKISTNTNQKPIIVWLQDNSSSVGEGLGEQLTQYQQQAAHLQDGIEVDYDLVTLNFGQGIEKNDETPYTATVTNMEQALLQVSQRYKGSNLGAVIVSSDGIYNEGADPNFVAQGFQVPIYTIALGDSSQVRDISVLRILANKVVMVGNDFEIAADLRFSKFPSTKHVVKLNLNGQTIQQKTLDIDASDEVKSVSFELSANQPGFYQYSIAVEDGGAEKTLMNNSMDFFVQVVSNDVKVAIINGGAHSDIGFIKNTLLGSVGYTVDVLPMNELPNNFSNYNILIAHQPNLSAAQWEKIKVANLPVWHILGNATSGTQAKYIEPLVKISGGRQQNMHQANLQKRFGGILLPVNATAVLSKLPPLESNISTASSADPNAVLLLSKDQKTAMWMLFTLEPRTAITIGEGLWRWGMYEYKDNKNQLVSQEIIRQSMQLLHVPKQDKPFQVFLNKRLLTDNENVAFAAELRNTSGQLVNDAVATLLITDSIGNEIKYEFEKIANNYQLVLPKMGAGIYSYKGMVQYKGINYQDQGTFAVENLPLEQLNTQANYGLLYQLSQQTNGQMFTLENMQILLDSIRVNEQIKTTLITNEKQDPFINYRWLFFVILGLLTAEWLFRKYNNMQ